MPIPLRVGVIGAGRMGRIRALSAKAHPACQVVHVSDIANDLAKALAAEVGCSSGVNWQAMLEHPDVDVVVVATPHKFLSPITCAAIHAGKYVFCEKPMARTAGEAKEVLNALDIAAKFTPTPSSTKSSDKGVVVGYTLRHHPAVARAKDVVDSGEVGELLYIRGRYGHGGRSGYEKEWRGSRDLAGGGELLDQGVHLIDLSRWFLGEFHQVTGFLNSYFWNSANAPRPGNVLSSAVPSRSVSQSGEVEDNAFMMLRTLRGQTAMLHASWTQWKNMFSLEVFGSKGFVTVEGLGGNYGQERLMVGKRRPEGGVPSIEEIRFEQPAQAGTGVTRDSNRRGSAALPIIASQSSCWDEEWADFVRIVQKRRESGENAGNTLSAVALDGLQNLRIVDALYSSAERNMPVELDLKPVAAVASLS